MVIVEGEGGEFEASHCNQWGLCCVVVCKCVHYSDRAVIWRGEWGGPRHSCVRWKSTCVKGKGLFLASFLAFFGICVCIVSIGDMMLRNAFDSCAKSLQYFQNVSLNSVYDWLSYDIVRFKIRVGVDAKCTRM